MPCKLPLMGSPVVCASRSRSGSLCQNVSIFVHTESPSTVPDVGWKGRRLVSAQLAASACVFTWCSYGGVRGVAGDGSEGGIISFPPTPTHLPQKAAFWNHWRHVRHSEVLWISPDSCKRWVMAASLQSIDVSISDNKDQLKYTDIQTPALARTAFNLLLLPCLRCPTQIQTYSASSLIKISPG